MNASRDESTYSRKTKLIIYSLGAAVFAFLLYINFYQTGMYKETISNGKKILTAIISIDCTRGKGRSRLFFKNEKNEVKHVNVSYTECEASRRGDTISVYVSEENNWYELDLETTRAASQHN